MEGAKAVEYLFSSLREVCPRVLVELRDTGGADVTVATEWASRHGLNCPSVINYASLCVDGGRGGGHPAMPGRPS